MSVNNKWGAPPILLLTLKLKQYIKVEEQRTLTDKLKRATLLLEQALRRARKQGSL